MGGTSMMDEQKKFLEECENEFKDRYTEKDSAFMKIKNMEIRKPPIVDPWYKPRRYQYEWPVQNQGQGRHSNAWERRNNEKGTDMIERHSHRHYSHRNYRHY